MPTISTDHDLAPYIIGVVAAGLTVRTVVRKHRETKQLKAIYGDTAIIRKGVVLTPIRIPCDRLA